MAVSVLAAAHAKSNEKREQANIPRRSRSWAGALPLPRVVTGSNGIRKAYSPESLQSDAGATTAGQTRSRLKANVPMQSSTPENMRSRRWQPPATWAASSALSALRVANGRGKHLRAALHLSQLQRDWYNSTIVLACFSGEYRRWTYGRRLREAFTQARTCGNR